MRISILGALVLALALPFILAADGCFEDTCSDCSAPSGRHTCYADCEEFGTCTSCPNGSVCGEPGDSQCY